MELKQMIEVSLEQQGIVERWRLRGSSEKPD
jgi:hypothetical protein